MKINLTDLLDGKFRFYLEDKYRKNLFTNPKQRCKDWRILAKELDINVRNLFGIRRGWEWRYGVKKPFMVSSDFLNSIKSNLNLNIKDIEKNITHIKLGRVGPNSEIRFPLNIDINKEPIKTLNRALAEHVYSNHYIKIKDISNLSKIFHKNKNYIEFNPNNKNKLKIVPNKIIFDEVFAKEFGKWIGDRCGGPRRVGVANKNPQFIKDFKNFLVRTLKQESPKIILRCKEGFIPSKELKKLANKIEFSTSQYGDYAYLIGIPNRELKELVFDKLEENIFNILYNSKKDVRCAFFSGLFEAEGSVDLRSKVITISFGFNLRKERENKDYLELLERVVKFKYLLEKDGFKPRISRKIGATKKSSTLKYDLVLMYSKKTRKQEVNFIKRNMVKFLNHNEKLQKFKQLEGIVEKDQTKKNESVKLQPEISIGFIGQ